jgi:hypothetical protein
MVIGDPLFSSQTPRTHWSLVIWTVKGLLEKDEHRTSNVEWEKIKKQTYDLEEKLLEYTKIAVVCHAAQAPALRVGIGYLFFIRCWTFIFHKNGRFIPRWIIATGRSQRRHLSYWVDCNSSRTTRRRISSMGFS